MTQFTLTLGLFVVTIASGISYADKSLAASMDQRIKACLEGKLNASQQEVLANDISQLKNAFSNFVISNAAKCYTTVTGEPSDFFNGVGLETNPEGISKLKKAAQREREEQEKKAQRQREEAERQREVREKEAERRREVRVKEAQRKLEIEAMQLALELQVNSKVHDACSKLARKDEVAAFTNALCVSSFKANGLPE